MKRQAAPVLLLLACCLLARAAHAGPEKPVEPVSGTSMAAPLQPQAGAGLQAGAAADVAGLHEMPPGDVASYRAAMSAILADDAASAYMAAHPEQAAAELREILATGASQDPAETFRRFKEQTAKSAGESDGHGSLASSFLRNARRSMTDLKDAALNRLYRDKLYVDKGSMVEVAHALAGAGPKREAKLLRRLEKRPDMARVLREKAAHHNDQAVRVAAIETLAAMKDKESVGLLSEKLARKHEDAAAAALALGRIGDRDASLALSQAFAAAEPGSALEGAAAEGILRLGHQGSMTRVSDRMDEELEEAARVGGWSAARISKRALDLYQDGNEFLQTNVERAILGMQQPQPRAIMRRARAIVERGGAESFNALQLVGPAIVILIGLILVYKVELILGFSWLIARFLGGTMFTNARGGENLEPAAEEIIGAK